MPPKKYNYSTLLGTKSGKLVAISMFQKRTSRGQMVDCFKCKCECGGEATPTAANFASGNSSSCGCKAKAAAVSRALAMAKHNMSHTPEHRAWSGMIERCFNWKNKDFKNWGGRGITVCDEWRKDFLRFYQYIGPRPAVGYSVDRINVDGNYEPGNVKWSTSREQQRNRRNNRLLTINGDTATFKEWCDRHGLKDDCVRRRIKSYGWSIEKALTTPKIKPRFSRVG